MHTGVSVNPHLRMCWIVHPGCVSLGTQPLPIRSPRVLPQISAILFCIHKGIGGKKGHLGIIGDTGRVSGLCKSLNTLGAILATDGILLHEFHRIAQRIPYRTAQQAAKVAAVHYSVGIRMRNGRLFDVFQRPEFSLVGHSYREGTPIQPCVGGQFRYRQLTAFGSKPLNSHVIKLPVHRKFRCQPKFPACIVGQVQQKYTGLSPVCALA